MNKGFSLLECVIYMLCITITFGLLGELMFNFHLRISRDLKFLRLYTSSFVCLNSIIHDLYRAVSMEGLKKVEHDRISVLHEEGEAIWAIKNKKLYRTYKQFISERGRSIQTASLMMCHVLKFDVVGYLQLDNRLGDVLPGFKILLKQDNGLDQFQHYVALRSNN